MLSSSGSIIWRSHLFSPFYLLLLDKVMSDFNQQFGLAFFAFHFLFDVEFQLFRLSLVNLQVVNAEQMFII